jgi:hypothetical protein
MQGAYYLVTRIGVAQIGAKKGLCDVLWKIQALRESRILFDFALQL